MLNRYFSISHGSIVLVIRVKSLLANFKDTIFIACVVQFSASRMVCQLTSKSS